MKRRILLFLGFLALAGSAAGAALGLAVREEASRSVDLGEKIVIEIQPGESLRRTAARLREAGLIGNERIFLGLAAWRGADRSIRDGRHEFEGLVTTASVLEELSRTPKPILRVTIPEGLTLREIAGLLEREGATSAAAYVAVACSEEFRLLMEAPRAAACAEGYLFPDTYDLVPGMSAGSIVDLQARRFREVAAPLLRDLPKDGETAQGEAPAAARVLTLASIVEKETARPSERAHIAGVFTNRLRLGMPLQTDPTVIYGVIDAGLPWDGNLTRAHLSLASPYNTYRIKGLPPGPICNPGRASLEAALRPTATDDLYFVARGNGSHEFSPTLAEHNRAVRRFQLQ